MIENHKVVTLQYQLFVDGEDGQEELMETASERRPLVYCHGENMMLPAFEQNMEGLEAGDSFDFRIPCEDAYGEYDSEGVLTLNKRLFYNGDGEFDAERVVAGNIVPMNTVDGQVVNAQVVEVNQHTVVIDLNHPLAGENLHFVGKVLAVRDVTEGELKALHRKGCCHGGCQSDCKDCQSDCGGCASKG